MKNYTQPEMLITLIDDVDLLTTSVSAKIPNFAEDDMTAPFI